MDKLAKILNTDDVQDMFYIVAKGVQGKHNHDFTTAKLEEELAEALAALIQYRNQPAKYTQDEIIKELADVLNTMLKYMISLDVNMDSSKWTKFNGTLVNKISKQYEKTKKVNECYNAKSEEIK